MSSGTAIFLSAAAKNGHCAYLTAIIDQHVIHRLIGSASVMAEQCAHLANIAERPR